MRRPILLPGVVLFFALAAIQAQQPPARVVKETWDAAYVEGAPAGYFHTVVQEVERDGRKLLVTTVSMDLKIRRYGELVSLRLESGTEETPDGKVVGVFLAQHDERGKLVQTGRVADGKLHISVGGQPRAVVPWDDAVIGLQAQDRLPAEKKAKPGDNLEFRNYELALLTAVRVRLGVKAMEEVEVLEAPRADPKAPPARVRRSLLRVEAVPDRIEVRGNPIQLPKLINWLDKDYQPLRAQLELPGLGVVTLYRTTEAVARREVIAALLPDLGRNTLIALNRPLDNVHQAREVVYRITLPADEENPASAFVRDARQEPGPARGPVFDLRVRAVREPVPVRNPAPAAPEFLESSHFLTSADEKVRELAAKAVGRETDPWKKARLIEKWVHDNMRGDSGVGFSTAAQIARELRGDCRQHALLTAAMCRAAGVPSRTALGLVYVRDPERGPVLGFHMWTEVYIDGQWLGIDAVLGQGSVGPGHLKIADHSWHDVQTLAPLLPVMRVMGRIKVEVVEFTP
jgi:hypothetical protein